MDLPRPVLIGLPALVFLVLVAYLLTNRPAPEAVEDSSAPVDEAGAPRSPGVPLAAGDQTAAGPGASRIQEGDPVSPPSKARTWKAGARSPLALPPPKAVHGVREAVVTRDSIQGAVNEILPQVKECVEGWIALDPGLEGHVVVEVRLGPEGLISSAIADHDGVPFGVQTCFASALVEAPWPTPPDGEFVVRYPFTFFGVVDAPAERPPGPGAPQDEEPEDPEGPEDTEE